MSNYISKVKLAKMVRAVIADGHVIRFYGEEGFEGSCRKEKSVMPLVNLCFDVEICCLQIGQANIHFNLEPQGLVLNDYSNNEFGEKIAKMLE